MNNIHRNVIIMCSPTMKDTKKKLVLINTFFLSLMELHCRLLSHVFNLVKPGLFNCFDISTSLFFVGQSMFVSNWAFRLLQLFVNNKR